MRKKLHILHICSSLAWGGGEMSALKLAQSFKDRGHTIQFAAYPDGRMMKELLNSGIETLPMKLIRYFDPVSIYQLIKILNHRSVDIIHVHMSRDLVHIYWALKFIKWKPPVILHKQVSSKVIKRDLFHRRIYSQVSKIFVLSNFLKENVLETCPVSHGKVVVIPGGIDPIRYTLQPEVRQRIRKNWGVDDDTVVLGTIGRIDRGKGFEELVRAFAKMVDTNPDTRLIVVGEPTAGEPRFAQEMTILVSELKLEKKIIFTGFRSDIPDILSAFDCFILASYGEAFGYVLLEASAASLPIIATNAGGVPDIVVDGETGLLVPPYDIEILRNAMEQLTQKADLRKKYGCAGREKIKKCFSEIDVLNKIEEEYYSLLFWKMFGTGWEITS